MIEHINWYPGHMKKTRELIAENLKMVDIVIEVIALSLYLVLLLVGLMNMPVVFLLKLFLELFFGIIVIFLLI